MTKQRLSPRRAHDHVRYGRKPAKGWHEQSVAQQFDEIDRAIRDRDLRWQHNSDYRDDGVKPSKEGVR